MLRKLSIHSETGRLRRVIVHTPGAEVEAMRPSRAVEELYNDIVPMEIDSFSFLQAKNQSYSHLD